MSNLLYAGILYLFGISVVLILKPPLMFRHDGLWKEFGIGRNQDLYTWFPFWLFAVIWAIVSYIIITLFIGGNTYNNINIVTEQPTQQVTPVAKRTRYMQPGYYILDASATKKMGTPKYIYLGPETPDVVYNDGTLTQSDLAR